LHQVGDLFELNVKLRRQKVKDGQFTGNIFGPVQNEYRTWRIRMNYELNELTENADIVRFIKSRRISWLGHGWMRMDDRRTPKRILQWKPIGTRTRRRSWKRWIVGFRNFAKAP
jgi:hypothetical protein